MSVLIFLLVHCILTFGLRYAYRISVVPGSTGPVRYSRKALIVVAAVGVLYVAFSASRKIFHDGMGGNDALIYSFFFAEADCSLKEFFTVRTNMVSEPGFRVLVWLVRQITAEYRVFLVLVHGFMFLSVANFNRYCRFETESPFSAGATFLICGELFYVFCILRNSLALALALWVFALLSERKYLWALLPMVLSVGMHLAALILIPVYVFVLLMDKLRAFTLKKTAVWLAALLAAECIVLPVFNMIIRNTRYSYYLGGGISWGTFAVVVVLTVSFLLFYRKQEPAHETHADVWIVLCAWFCLPLQMNYSIFYRSLLMFSPMFYKMIPSVVHRYYAMEDRTLLKKLIRWGGIAALFGYMLIRAYKMYSYDFISYGIYPYVIG